MCALCDACESALAIVFCAADEATLCLSCDEKSRFELEIATNKNRQLRGGLGAWLKELKLSTSKELSSWTASWTAIV
ncbi:hypothetical protein DKX38_007725 [Salix brachista]|uniref:B box-type domain-containing protein n=1 Tax=Salix brachista TaxID=2182728 RepID=A0A5N5MRK1_9ROSI|nr:hypothetical protein DKX38_007725 [Salix brachista]